MRHIFETKAIWAEGKYMLLKLSLEEPSDGPFNYNQIARYLILLSSSVT